MAWDFDTDPEYQKVLDWADEFVREEIEPLDLAFPDQQYIPLNDNRRKIIDPLKEEVRRRGLWATHLGPESCVDHGTQPSVVDDSSNPSHVIPAFDED